MQAGRCGTTDYTSARGVQGSRFESSTLGQVNWSALKQPLVMVR